MERVKASTQSITSIWQWKVVHMRPTATSEIVLDVALRQREAVTSVRQRNISIGGVIFWHCPSLPA